MPITHCELTCTNSYSTTVLVAYWLLLTTHISHTGSALPSVYPINAVGHSNLVLAFEGGGITPRILNHSSSCRSVVRLGSQKLCRGGIFSGMDWIGGWVRPRADSSSVANIEMSKPAVNLATARKVHDGPNYTD
jgi:hypothetical protein